MGSAAGQANAKGLRQKQAPMDEARLIDSMAQPGGHVPLRRDVGFGELFGAVEQGLEGDDLIRRAMDQQHRRRLAPDVAGGGAGEMLGADQHAGKAEDGGGRALAAQAHMQRHHGSLAETDERELAVVKARRLKLGVKKGVEAGLGGVDAPPALVGIAHGEGKPLPPRGRHAAGLGRMGGDEGRLRQDALPLLANINQIPPIGAIAVQEDHQLPGRARTGRKAWAGEGGVGRCRHACSVKRRGRGVKRGRGWTIMVGEPGIGAGPLN